MQAVWSYELILANTDLPQTVRSSELISVDARYSSKEQKLSYIGKYGAKIIRTFLYKKN